MPASSVNKVQIWDMIAAKSCFDRISKTGIWYSLRRQVCPSTQVLRCHKVKKYMYNIRHLHWQQLPTSLHFIRTHVSQSVSEQRQRRYRYSMCHVDNNLISRTNTQQWI